MEVAQPPPGWKGTPARSWVTFGDSKIIPQSFRRTGSFLSYKTLTFRRPLFAQHLPRSPQNGVFDL